MIFSQVNKQSYRLMFALDGRYAGCIRGAWLGKKEGMRKIKQAWKERKEINDSERRRQTGRRVARRERLVLSSS